MKYSFNKEAAVSFFVHYNFHTDSTILFSSDIFEKFTNKDFPSKIMKSLLIALGNSICNENRNICLIPIYFLRFLVKFGAESDTMLVLKHEILWFFSIIGDFSDLNKSELANLAVSCLNSHYNDQNLVVNALEVLILMCDVDGTVVAEQLVRTNCLKVLGLLAKTVSDYYIENLILRLLGKLSKITKLRCFLELKNFVQILKTILGKGFDRKNILLACKLTISLIFAKQTNLIREKNIHFCLYDLLGNRYMSDDKKVTMMLLQAIRNITESENNIIYSIHKYSEGDLSKLIYKIYELSDSSLNIRLEALKFIKLLLVYDRELVENGYESISSGILYTGLEEKLEQFVGYGEENELAEEIIRLINTTID